MLSSRQLWAIAQERLSVPFLNTDGTKSERFRSALIMSTCQSAFSVVSSFIYIFVRRKPGETLYAALGLEPTHVKSNAVTPYKSSQNESVRDTKMNGNGNAATIVHPTELETAVMRRALLTRYLQCALFITAAAPFGFAALAHISYPAMVLGKSCKLVPVLLMNVLLYHRRFACHKYVVVALVTAGITMFMGLGDKGSSKGHGSSGSMEEAKGSNTIGIMYLLINLAIDGATNSTQDEIFKRYAVTGQQMMFWINLMSTFVTTALALLPLPYIPVLHPSEGWSSELANVSTFIREHPEVASPLAQFALTGAMGQLFIFETLQHFGSLTLVMITLTRKLFTMILSVIVYNHKLTTGQWAGAAVVFAGISVEAWVKRKDVHAKRVMQEKEKAEIKSL
ncbi:hypothetical protein EW145_g517 [Phellinidium pouzarii]|uniref:UDP-galactose transporter homolog 1 n=1 Tax=Phellinidium pouzarii TaxID=167371 RepID=A0A4S4LNJ1_9AGAM|nr:hypothetical protein EW145_g517 [Phellinidium pouzarii]